MATNSRDISLVIRAKSEADRAFKEAATAAAQFGSGVAQLEGQLKKLEGQEERTARTLGDVGRGLDAQANKIAGVSRAIDTQPARIAELTAALERLKRESAKDFVGPALFGGNLKTARSEIAAIERELRGLSAVKFAGLQAQLVTEVEKFRQLRQVQIDLRETQAPVRAAVQETTEAWLRQVRAIELATLAASKKQNSSALLGRIEGAANQVSGKSAEASASVFVAAGPTRFEADTARAEEVAGLRAAAAAHAAFEARVRLGADAMRLADKAAEAEAAEIVHLKNALNPAAAAEAHLAAETQKLDRWLRAGTITAQEHAVAIRLVKNGAELAAKSLTGLDSRGRPALFGLKPYELQNLSFQINDIFTQLASGTSLTQTLAQQIGQIFQLFPRIGSAVAAGLTSVPILAFTALIGTMIFAIVSAADKAEKLRALGGILAASADGGRTSAKALLEVTKQLDLYGLSAEEAMTITRQLFAEGLDEASIVRFGQAAKDLADVMGIDLKDATTQVVAAQRGGAAAIDELDKKYNFLSASQRAQIKLLFDQGRALEATALAMEIFGEKMRAGAEEARGPWAEAFRELGNAWTHLKESFADSEFGNDAVNTLKELTAIVDGLTYALNLFSGAKANAVKAPGKELDATQWARVLQGGDPGAPASGGAAVGARGGRGSSPSPQVKQASEAQIKADQRLAEATQRRVVAETKITSEKAIQTRLAQVQIDALAEAKRNEPLSSEAAQRVAAERVVATERRKLEKELADYVRQQAADTKRIREEREKAARFVQFRDPVDNARVTSGFGPRKSPGAGGSTFHKGIDFAVPVGTAVKAPAVGTVETIGFDPKLGKFVIIDHGNNTKSRFGHLSVNDLLKEGDPVSAGQVIGKSGNTGSATTGAHLHFQIEVNGTKVDPRQNGGKFEIDASEAASNVDDEIDKRSEEAQKLRTDRDNKRDNFDLAVRQTNEDLQGRIDALGETNRLEGEALIIAERRAAIAQAENELRQQNENANKNLKPGQDPIPLLDEEIAKRRELVGLEFDLASARDLAAAQSDDAGRRVDDLTAERDAIQGQIEALRAVGDGVGADALEDRLKGINAELRSAIDSVIEFYRQLDPATDPLLRTREQIDAVIAGLETAKQSTIEWTSFMGIGGQEIAQLFAQTATAAFDRFAEAVANGENVFESLWDAFRQFAADFLRQIAQMIIKQLIFNLVAGILKSISGAPPVPVPGIQAHSGGIIGGAGPTPRAVSPTWFANAQRYHSGGIAGLRADEVPAVLRRGEEVLTESDPRHRGNGGLDPRTAPAPNIKIVNAIDAGDFVSKGLSTRTGETALLNFIKANLGAVRAAMR